MAEKGKIKVIKDGSGGIVTDKKGVDYEFTQPNYQALCLGEGDEVKFDLINLRTGTPAAAVNVERLTAGTILEVDATGNGRLSENKTQKVINFFQPFPTECGCKVGEIVKYNLINTPKGELAVNLTGVGE
jgi:hypothetical protein